MFARAGFAPVRELRAFGGRCRWIEGVAAAPRHPSGGVGAAAGAGRARARCERAARARRDRKARAGACRGLEAAGTAVAIWGMATKGIIYSTLVDPASSIVDVAVDINANKQGCFVPTTGRRIDAPTALQAFGGRHLAVVVMNTNYVGEIREACRGLGVVGRLPRRARDGRWRDDGAGDRRVGRYGGLGRRGGTRRGLGAATGHASQPGWVLRRHGGPAARGPGALRPAGAPRVVQVPALAEARLSEADRGAIERGLLRMAESGRHRAVVSPAARRVTGWLMPWIAARLERELGPHLMDPDPARRKAERAAQARARKQADKDRRIAAVDQKAGVADPPQP